MIPRPYNTRYGSDNQLVFTAGTLAVVKVPCPGAGVIRRIAIRDVGLTAVGAPATADGYSADFYDHSDAFSTDLSAVGVGQVTTVVMNSDAVLHKLLPTQTVAASSRDLLAIGEWAYNNDEPGRNESGRYIYLVLSIAGSGTKKFELAITVEPITTRN